MDLKFLNYYNQELTFVRELASEFAQKHPKIASRLGMQGINVADPYVERLIEAFCFLSARTQLKLDAEFPHFTQRLLDVIYPNYNSPTPSMGVVQLKPNLKEGDLTQGYHVKPQSALHTCIPAGEITRCEFRTSQEVTLWPLEIVEARLTSVPPDIPNLEPYRISHHKLKGALRIKLHLKGEVLFSQLAGLDRLPIYINGDERIASHIFELVHASHVAVILRGGNENASYNHVVSNSPLSFEGLQPDQSLLPVSWNIFHGHNLMQEYFSCRQRFYFFTPTQLAQGLKHNHTQEAEIIILLDRLEQNLIGHIDPACFLLFCTPAINLFPKRMDKIELNRAQNDFQIVPDRSRPLDFELFSIRNVFGQQAETAKEIVFNPLYQTRHCDNGNFGRYYSVTRRPRNLNHNRTKYDTRTPYAGTEVFISLVDQQEAPYGDDIRYLSIEALVTNRDLPRLISQTAAMDLTMVDSAPVHGAHFVCQPSAPRPAFASGESAWRLIRQLNFNYLPLSNMNHAPGGEALRNMLRLYVTTADRESLAQISGLVSCQTEPVIRRLPGDGLLVYGRGVRCTLTVDEENFSGISPYLFGLIMENYIARHAAINVFTEMELHSMQRGRIGQWKPRPGKRGAL